MKRIISFLLLSVLLCSVVSCSCGKKNKNEEHTHSYTVKYDENNHWSECSCGEKKDTTAHTFTSSVTKEPTTTSKGEKTYECLCGYSYKEDIPMIKDDEGLSVSLNRSTFIVGQYLEYTDMVVKFDGTVVTDFSFDLEGVLLTTSHNKVKVTYGTESKEVSFTVVTEESHVTGIEMLVKPNLVLTDTSSLEKIAMYRKVYDNKSYSEYEYALASEITLTQDDDEIIVKVEKDINGTKFNTSVRIENKVEVLTFTKPIKVYYAIGETLDLTGGTINFDYYFGEDKHVVITKEMVNEAEINFNTAGKYNVKVTYESSEFNYDLTVVKAIESLEIVKPLTENQFTLGGGIANIAKSFETEALKVTYTDTTVEYFDIVSDMLSGTWEMGNQTITVTLVDKTTTFNVEVISSGISVSEFVDTKPTGEVTIHGVVVGYNYTYTPNTVPTSRGVVLKDETASKWVFVGGIGDAKVGDVIDFKGTTATENGRYYLNYVSGYTLEYHTEDKSIIELDLSTAVTIADHETFKTIFSDANRANTYNTIYKLHGNFGLVWYYETARICFPGVTSYGYGEGKQYFNGTLSAVFRPYMIEDNTSYTLEDLCTKNTSYANITPCEKDVYVIYSGQTGVYYANFVILGDYCIKDLEPIVKSFEPTEELKTLYLLGEDLDLIGKTFEKSYYYGEDAVQYEVDQTMITSTPEFDKNTAGKYTITVTKDGYSYSYEVKYVTEITKSIDLIGYDEERTITGTDLSTIDLTNLQIKRVTTQDAEYNFAVTVDMLSLSGVMSVGEDNYIRREVIVEYEGVQTKILVKGELVHNIDDAFDTSTGDVLVYYGVVVGYNFIGNSSSTAYETVVKDVTKSQVICVTGLGDKMVSGDLVVFTAATSYMSAGDNKTRTGLTVSNNNYCQVGHTDDKKIIELDLSGAKLYTDHQDFVSDFSDANRPSQYYKVVKFDVTLGGNRSYDNIWRIYLPAETPISGTGFGVGKQYFNSSLSPTFKTKMVEKNLGIKAVDFLGNVKSWTGPQTGQYVYAVYCGSSGVYYGDFVILGTYMLGGTN